MEQTTPIFVCNDDAYVAKTCSSLVKVVDDGKVTVNAFVHGSYPGLDLDKDVLAGFTWSQS